MELTENKEIMSRNIRKYLGYNKMTAQELANKLDVAKATVSGWVNGIYYPRIVYIEKMAELFGCNKSDLIEDNTKSRPNYDYAIQTDHLSLEETILIEIYRNETDRTRDMIKQLLNYDETMKNLIGGNNNEFMQNLKKQIPNKRNG